MTERIGMTNLSIDWICICFCVSSRLATQPKLWHRGLFGLFMSWLNDFSRLDAYNPVLARLIALERVVS
jgi:hypothetical protein